LILGGTASTVKSQTKRAAGRIGRGTVSTSWCAPAVSSLRDFHSKPTSRLVGNAPEICAIERQRGTVESAGGAHIDADIHRAAAFERDRALVLDARHAHVDSRRVPQLPPEEADDGDDRQREQEIDRRDPPAPIARHRSATETARRPATVVERCARVDQDRRGARR